MNFQQTAQLDGGYGAKVAYSPRGMRWVAVAPAQFHLWTGTQRTASVELRGQTGSVSFSADERLLLLSPLLYDVQANDFINLPPLNEALVAGIPTGSGARYDQFEVSGGAWDHDGQQLAIYTQYRPPRRIGAVSNYSGPTRRILLLDGGTRALKHVLWEGSSAAEYRAIAFSRKHIAAAWQQVLLWNAETGQQVATFSGPIKTVRDLRFSPNGTQLATADWNGQITMWNVNTQQVIAQWSAHKGSARTLAFHPTEPLLVTGGDDPFVNVFQIGGGQTERVASLQVAGPVDGIAFHPNGRELVVAVSVGHLVQCLLT